MKKLWIMLLCLSLGTASVNAQDSKKPVAPNQPTAPLVPKAVTTPVPLPSETPDPNAGKFKFEEETHDFGEVMEGPLAECDFKFKNVGKSPIIITESHGSCGCTVPQWPHDPILPKHTGVIHVTYNTQGRVGPISKDVIITSNAQQNPMKLHITGMVKAKPAISKPILDPPPPPPAPTK